VKPLTEEMGKFFAKEVREKLAATRGIAEWGKAIDCFYNEIIGIT